MAELFNLTFPTDLSEFTSTVTDSGDMAQNSAAGLGGTTGGVRYTIDDTTAIYGLKDFTALGASPTDFRYRFYFDFGSLTTSSGNDFVLCNIERATGGIVESSISLKNVSGTLKFNHKLLTDAGSPTSNDVTIGATSGYVEVWITKATTNSSADATSKMYINGSLSDTISGLDLYDAFELIARMRIGAVGGLDAGTSGSFDLDEMVSRNDSTVIGANNTAPVLTAIGNHRAVKGRAKLIVIVPTDTDSNLTKIAYLCDEAKGDWDCTLSGSASVTTGSKPSHTFEVTGTHAEIVATAATSTFTPTINTGSDTTCQITITDASAATDSETFTVECYGARVYGSTQAGINATLATLGLTHDTAEGATVEMTSVDSGDRTDVDGSVVTFVDNAAPTADAGPGQSVVVGQLVTLDGTGSSDPEDDTLTYQWTLVDEPTGSSVSLDDDTAAQPTFTPTHPGDYSFTLVVNDGTTDSAADGVTIAAAVGERVSASVASVMKARRRNLVHSPLRNRYRWRT